MNLLLGADSLAALRSGVGRMTLEIATALRHHRGVNGMRLLVGDAVLNPDWLDALPDPAPPSPPSRLRTWLQTIPAARLLRDRTVRARLARAARALEHHPTVRAQSSDKYAWQNKTLQPGQPTLYFEPNMIAKPFDGPTVAGFNDLSWLHCPGAHPAERVAWIERRLPATLCQANRFVAISAFTARAMQAEFGIPSSRIDVVPLAPGPEFRPRGEAAITPILARHGLRHRSYVLAVSTLEPRKNFDGLLAAWSALPTADRNTTPLVVVGARGWGEVLESPTARAALANGTLRLPGHLPDEDLAALYAGCAVFAYVSHYEGFGLPILEAMASGAPVIASSTTACSETAGKAALLVQPEDHTAITAALHRILNDPALAETLRQRGIAHAQTFNWATTADRLMASFNRALSSS